MTTQRRGRQAGRGRPIGRRASGRLVWNTAAISTTLTVDTIVGINMDNIGEPATRTAGVIQRVLFPILTVAFDAAATLETRRFRMALALRLSSIDSADFNDLFTSHNDGPDWLIATGRNLRLAATAQAVTVDMTEGFNNGAIDARVKRRRAQDVNTLWLVFQN